MGELLRRIAYLWNRRRRERDLEDEMAYHRELMPRERQMRFGDPLRIREDTREVWGWFWLDRLRQDLAYGSRVLWNSPGFTITAMLVLTLGIGVPLTALRNVLNDLQGSSPDPDALVQLTRRAPGVYITKLPYPEIVYYAAGAKSFRSVICVSDGNDAVFGDAASRTAPEQVHAAFVTSNYFPEFGVAAAAGRVFTANDERPDAEPVAMVSELFWSDGMGRDPAAIGKAIRVNGKLVTVVGIVPLSATITDQVWIPLARQPFVVQGSHALTDWNSSFDAYARLKPGVTPKASEQETLALAARLHRVRSHDVREGEYLGARPILQFDTSSHEFQIVLAGVALVLLLLVAACANLGTLVLARGVTRDREIRTRLALGASRPRLVRQLFTESLLLAWLSGLCALFLSSGVLKIIQLRHNRTSSMLPDWRAVAATVAAAMLAALVFGLPAALRATKLTPGAGRARTIFLGTQVAVSFLLLVISGLIVTGLQRLNSSDPGFAYRGLVWVSPGLKAHGYNSPSAQAYMAALRVRAMGWKEVKAASQVWLAPWGSSHTGVGFAGREFAGNHVDSHFLDAMAIRLVRGRNIEPREQGVAIVSESAARVLWPKADPLRKSLPWDPHGATVIGVARDASTTAVSDADPLEFYTPLGDDEASESVLLLRVTGDPHLLTRRVRDAARGMDATLQPSVQVVTDAYDEEVQHVSRALAVITLLGTVAILLSVVGLAGLAGYTVAQRTREIGLRVALGARPRQVILSVLGPMVRPISFGLACGAIGGAVVTRVLRAATPTLAGMNLFDPLHI